MQLHLYNHAKHSRWLLRNTARACSRLLETSAAENAKANDAKTNVVLILIDDLGWKDMGCYGSDYYKHPTSIGWPPKECDLPMAMPHAMSVRRRGRPS